MPTEGSSELVGLTLRPALRGDAETVAALYGAVRQAAVPAMPAPVHTADDDREFFAGRLADDECEGWVAESGGRLVGFALLTPTWLDALYVDPAVQRSGVGSALLDVVRSRRPEGVGLWVFESNEPARSFYARHHFVELERTDGSANEEGAPDVKMVWPGRDPLRYFRRMIDEVDDALGDLLLRRAALTGAVQEHKRAVEEVDDPARDAGREQEVVRRVAARVPTLGEDQVARIVHAIISESIEASRD
jgi:chorismate mutase/GNAT superfamily N-acetyltransferase